MNTVMLTQPALASSSGCSISGRGRCATVRGCLPSNTKPLPFFGKRLGREQQATAGASSTRPTITCMAKGRRVQRVSKQLEREIGDLLVTDRVVLEAMCPDRRQSSLLSAVTSVTRINLSNDLRYAKVYISVMSDDEGKQRAVDGLHRITGYMRRQVAGRMQLRFAPEIRFIYDDTEEQAEEVELILARMERERLAREAAEAAGQDYDDYVEAAAAAAKSVEEGRGADEGDSPEEEEDNDEGEEYDEDEEDDDGEVYSILTLDNFEEQYANVFGEDIMEAQTPKTSREEDFADMVAARNLSNYSRDNLRKTRYQTNRKFAKRRRASS